MLDPTETGLVLNNICNECFLYVRSNRYGTSSIYYLIVFFYNDLDRNVLAQNFLLFLAELNHTSPNSNRPWSLRIGRGGFIYSFVGPLGEAVPPQHMPYLAP